MRLYIVDAFTSEAFAGNSAGVVLLDAPADAGWMQSVAASARGGIVRMNLEGDRVRLSGQAVTVASGELHV